MNPDGSRANQNTWHLVGNTWHVMNGQPMLDEDVQIVGATRHVPTFGDCGHDSFPALSTAHAPPDVFAQRLARQQQWHQQQSCYVSTAQMKQEHYGPTASELRRTSAAPHYDAGRSMTDSSFDAMAPMPTWGRQSTVLGGHSVASTVGSTMQPLHKPHSLPHPSSYAHLPLGASI